MSAKTCTTLPWNRALRMVGDPVDVVTGAQAFFETDFRLRGEHIPVSWTRHYDSRRHSIDRGIGPGFQLPVPATDAIAKWLKNKLKKLGGKVKGAASKLGKKLGGGKGCPG